MYVTRGGQTIATVVTNKYGCGAPQVLSTRAQRRLIHLRGLRGLGESSSGGVTNPAGGGFSRPFSNPNPSGVRAIGPIIQPGGPFNINNTAPPTGTTGTGITTTPPTAPAVPGSPVPQTYPTSQLFTDSSGNVWQYQTSSGQWVQISTTTAAPPSGYIANTPVPVGTPTNQPFVDRYGNIWTYEPYAGTWIETSVTGSAATSGGYYSGTPVPVGYPTSEAYTDSYGNVWTYSTATGTWQESSAYSTALMAATSGGVLPAGYAAPVAATSDTQSLLDWFSEQTLINGVPNWLIAAAAGFAALKLSHSGKGR